MKPLVRKNYGSIPHLPNSRMGPADHSCHEGQLRICTIKARDRHDVVIVTEKLDGSNVGIARVGAEIHALSRAGYLAASSPYEQHHLFAEWVRDRNHQWMEALEDGERLVGEWLAQAHGSRYRLPHGPFVAFDLMSEERRAGFGLLRLRCERFDIPLPKIIHIGGPIRVEEAMALHGWGDHGVDEPEGVVYRVERRGEFDFMAKWVRPDKVDGKFLPGLSNSVASEPVWNWRPSGREVTS